MFNVEINVDIAMAPKLQEAFDIVEIEEIERDLGY